MCKYTLHPGVGTPRGRTSPGLDFGIYILRKFTLSSGALAIRLVSLVRRITLLSFISLYHLGNTWFMAIMRNIFDCSISTLDILQYVLVSAFFIRRSWCRMNRLHPSRRYLVISSFGLNSRLYISCFSNLLSQLDTIKENFRTFGIG